MLEWRIMCPSNFLNLLSVVLSQSRLPLRFHSHSVTVSNLSLFSHFSFLSLLGLLYSSLFLCIHFYRSLILSFESHMFFVFVSLLPLCLSIVSDLRLFLFYPAVSFASLYHF